MSSIVINGDDMTTIPWKIGDVKIYLKPTWADEWQYWPEMELVHAVTCAAAHDLGSATIQYRYGRVMEPWEAEYRERAAMNLDNWWLLIEINQQTVWVGQITNDTRSVTGTMDRGHSQEKLQTGRQEFVAYEPMQLLRKLPLSKSVWLAGTEQNVLGWVADFNYRSQSGFLKGNRSHDRSVQPAVYGFGGSDLWSRYDMLEYLLARFCNSGTTGPIWSIGGQADLLKSVQDAVSMSGVATIADGIRRIISTEMGLDYRITTTAVGFEVHVFALVAQTCSFNYVSLPKNPNTVSMVIGDDPSTEARIVRSLDQVYDTVRLVGKRIVQCVTLRGTNLIGKWSSDLETEYNNGTGTPADPASEHDEARRQDRFGDVYVRFAAPDTWGQGAPKLSADGIVYDTSTEYQPHQKTVRETLSWLPMYSGYDYAIWPPKKIGPDGQEPGVIRAMAWIQDPETNKYIPIDQAGIGLSVLKTDWGILLSPKLNHMVAKNHFSGDTLVDPIYNYSTLVVTIAYEGDQRLVIEYGTPPVNRVGSVIEIPVDEAECWWIRKGTIVGVDKNGALQPIGESDENGGAVNGDKTGFVTRNDATTLSFRMAGAIARYIYQRNRAEISIRGLLEWGVDIIGSILTSVDEGGDWTEIQAPITSVEWTMGDKPQTIIRTGFAR